METLESTHAPAATTPRPRWKTYLIAGGAVLGALLVVFAVGYFTGRGELTAAIAKHDTLAAETAKSQATMAQTLDGERRMVQKLEARRCLDQAVTALDARNFGIAQERLKQATQRLAASRVEGGLLELHRSLEGFRLVATEDLGAQRQKLLEFVSAFDRALPSR